LLGRLNWSSYRTELQLYNHVHLTLALSRYYLYSSTRRGWGRPSLFRNRDHLRNTVAWSRSRLWHSTSERAGSDELFGTEDSSSHDHGASERSNGQVDVPRSGWTGQRYGWPQGMWHWTVGRPSMYSIRAGPRTREGDVSQSGTGRAGGWNSRRDNSIRPSQYRREVETE
jgi:hypothetical protein